MSIIKAWVVECDYAGHSTIMDFKRLLDEEFEEPSFAYSIAVPWRKQAVIEDLIDHRGWSIDKSKQLFCSFCTEHLSKRPKQKTDRSR